MSQDTFYMDDRVFYAGSRFAQELNNKVGWVVSRVQNQDDSYVVFFENMKNDASYILSVQNMVKIRPAKTDDGGLVIQPRRVKIDDL